jgi:hypothetical protein
MASSWGMSASEPTFANPQLPAESLKPMGNTSLFSCQNRCDVQGSLEAAGRWAASKEITGLTNLSALLMNPGMQWNALKTRRLPNASVFCSTEPWIRSFTLLNVLWLNQLKALTARSFGCHHGVRLDGMPCCDLRNNLQIILDFANCPDDVTRWGSNVLSSEHFV